MTRLCATIAACLLGTTAAMAQQSDLTIAIQLEPPFLDPTAGAAGAIDSVLYSNVFEGLTKIVADGSVQPGLAERWEMSEDETTYTFHLREGVTFHDGTAMDAEDVKFSLDRIQAEDSANAQKALYTAIEDVTVIDPLTVELRLSHPLGDLLFNLAWGDAVIVAPESVEGLKQTPIGTGPFRFQQWVQGDRIDLARYAEYWGEAPALDQVTFRFISDPTAAFAAMMAQDVDVFSGYPAPENLPQFEADPRFNVTIGQSEGETILAMNNKAAPLDSPEVRAAIAHAIDRRAVIDGAMFGLGEPIGTHFSPLHPDYLDLTDLSAFDPEESKRLLADAGLSEGLSLSLALPPPSYARRGGEIIAAQLQNVGIDVQIRNLEWAQWLEQVLRGKDFDLTIISHTEPFDIGIYARPDYYFQYGKPEFVALMDQVSLSSDPAERTDLLHQAQRMLAEDHVNGFLFQLPFPTVADARITGLWENQPTQANDLTGVRWTE